MTSRLNDSHEFGYFWGPYLNDGLHLKAYDRVPWDELQYRLRQIAAAFEKPVVYKNVLVGMHLKGMFEICRNSLFIRTERARDGPAGDAAGTRQYCIGFTGISGVLKKREIQGFQLKHGFWRQLARLVGPGDGPLGPGT